MSDPTAPTEGGWIRYFVKSSGLLERDVSVYRDEALEDQLFTVTGDKHGAEVVDAAGSLVLTAVGKKALLAKIEYTNPDGTSAGHLKTNSVLSKKKMELTLADGTEWTVVKPAGLKQAYSVLEHGEPIATMDLKALALKRTYPVDIAEQVDLPLAFGLVWAINFTHLHRGAAGGAAAG